MTTYNHIGQVVTDLNRSKRFYQEVLGFKFWYEIQAPEEATAKLVSLASPLRLTAAYMTLDGLVLELLYYAAPGAVSAFRRRSMNEPGLTHLSISVDDINATARKAVEYGGQMIAESDIGFALFIRDPDGQLLELLPTSSRANLPPKPP
jgi:catechol 2,3-dioxygenase-like lactoylglutathione lyase family enzyme